MDQEKEEAKQRKWDELEKAAKENAQQIFTGGNDFGRMATFGNGKVANG